MDKCKQRFLLLECSDCLRAHKGYPGRDRRCLATAYGKKEQKVCRRNQFTKASYRPTCTMQKCLFQDEISFQSLISRHNITAFSKPGIMITRPIRALGSHGCKARWPGEWWSWAESCKPCSWPEGDAARSRPCSAGCSSPCTLRIPASTSCASSRGGVGPTSSPREASAARSPGELLARGW